MERKSLWEFRDLPPGCTGFGDCDCDVCFPPEKVYPLASHYFSVPLSRWQRFRRLFTWHYIRQTTLVLPVYMRWLNRG